MRKIEGDLSRTIKNSSAWHERDLIIQSLPGAGAVLSVSLLAGVPELGTLNRRQFAALIGVAPLNRDSGKFRGRRCIRGGRANVRAALYMAAVTAMQHNPVIRTFYTRLIEKRPLHKSIKQKSEMLRQAQHDNKELFCHSEELLQRRILGYAKVSIENGKPFKVAITACMRKLLTIINTMIKTKTLWNENLIASA